MHTPVSVRKSIKAGVVGFSCASIKLVLNEKAVPSGFQGQPSNRPAHLPARPLLAMGCERSDSVSC